MERDQFQYIVDATNHIHCILLETIEPSEDDFRKVFAVSCNTLTKVVAQEELLIDLRALGMRQEQYRAEYKEITENVHHFVGGFCSIETQVLIAAGIDRSAAESLIEEATNLRKSIRDLRINPNEVWQSLTRLRSEACILARQLQHLPSKRNQDRRDKKTLKRFFCGIGGAAVVGIDGGLLALSLGMSLAGTAVSGGFGCALMGVAFTME